MSPSQPERALSIVLKVVLIRSYRSSCLTTCIVFPLLPFTISLSLPLNLLSSSIPNSSPSRPPHLHPLLLFSPLLRYHIRNRHKPLAHPRQIPDRPQPPAPPGPGYHGRCGSGGAVRFLFRVRFGALVGASMFFFSSFSPGGLLSVGLCVTLSGDEGKLDADRRVLFCSVHLRALHRVGVVGSTSTILVMSHLYPDDFSLSTYRRHESYGLDTSLPPPPPHPSPANPNSHTSTE